MADKKNMIQTQNNTVVVALNELEITALLEVLQLAKSTASILAKTEMERGGSQATRHSAKMTRIAQDANELMWIVSTSARIGEPESEEIN